jgi:TonB-linked SusC/RagA family outer membrane protein
MKKKRNNGTPAWIGVPKKMLTAKVKMLALMCFLSVAVHAQPDKLDARLTRCPMSEVITYLKKHTGYDFLYRKDLLDERELVDVSLKDASLEEALSAIFGSRELEYEIVNKVIVLKKATGRPAIATPQERVRVSGVIKGPDGQPLPGATVRVSGTTHGVAADAEGKFEISFVPVNGCTILVSFVGMEDRAIPYAGQKELNVTLQEKPELMEEIIIMGYSSRKVSEMTGSVQQFHGEQLTSLASGGNLMNALRGHTTGLQITGSTGRPGSDGSLLLRGLGTIYDVLLGNEQVNTSPLIVIDGVITNYSSLSGVIAPSDVADITILKDASSTAIYGSRAATGVIVVTTKKGSREQMTLSVSLRLGASVPSFGGLKYMTSPELIAYGKKAMGNWWENDPALKVAHPDKSKYVEGSFKYMAETYDLTKTTNWRDLVYRTARVADASASVHGGNEKVRYYFSYNYINEQGTRIGYEMTRHMLRARLDFDLTSFLSVGANLSGAFNNEVTPQRAGAESFHPWLSPFDANGALVYSIPGETDFDRGSQHRVNVLIERAYNNNILTRQHLSGSFHGTVRPFSWLSFTSTNTVTLGNSNDNYYVDSRTYSGNSLQNSFANGNLSIGESRDRSFLTSNVLRFQHATGDHEISALVGQEWYERWSRQSTVYMHDQIIAGERNIGGFAKQGDKSFSDIPTGTEAEAASFSIFSEAHYNYARRYIASVSFRRDGSTNFGKKNRYGNFYSIGASWVASEERFLRDDEVISNLKLRLSYGTSGKEAGRDYLNYTLYEPGEIEGNYYHKHPHYPASYATGIAQLGNDRLSWETARNLNIGVDVGLFDQRVQLSVDKYRRVNTDLIMSVTLAAGHGVGAQYRNVGEMINDGVEVVLNTHNLKGKFNWHSNFTLSYNKNKLSKLDNGHLVRSGYPTLQVGDDISTLKRIKFAGVDPENGKPLYERVEEDGTITVHNSIANVNINDMERSKIYAGLSRAPLWGGFSNTFSWREWELSVNTAYAFRYQVLNPVKHGYVYGRAWINGNLFRVPSAWKIWEKKGDVADLPVVNANPALLRTEQDTDNESTLLYSNASHWRISSVRLDYAIPARWTARLGLRSAGLYFLLDNVYAFTAKDFAGRDPENPDGWAAPRRFIFGLNFNF